MNRSTNFISPKTRKLQFPRVRKECINEFLKRAILRKRPHRDPLVVRGDNNNNNNDNNDDDNGEGRIRLRSVQTTTRRDARLNVQNK